MCGCGSGCEFIIGGVATGWYMSSWNAILSLVVFGLLGFFILVIILTLGAKDVLFPASLLFVSLFSTSEAHRGFSPVFCTVGVS